MEQKTRKEVVTGMNIKKFIIPVLVALMSAIISFSGVAQAGPPGGADIALFDTGNNDEYVTCSCRSKCELNIAVTNSGATDDGIKIVFRDNREITLAVPKGDSRSYSQYIATEKWVDDEIIISPYPGGNPMVMWITVKGPGSKCEVTTP